MAIRLGSWGLPEFGVTEKLQSVFAPQKSYTPSGGSNLVGGNAPMVLGASTTSGTGAQPMAQGPGGAYPIAGGYRGGTGTAGGGGGQPAGQSNIGQQAPLEPTPGQPDFSAYDAAVNQAMEALNAGESAFAASRDAAIQEAEAGGALRTKQAQQAQTEKLGALGTQRTREEGKAENAIAAARRQAAELQQGIQSRFGKSTGTGAFTGELMGRAALQNIGGIQTGLQDTMTQINQAEQNVRNTTSSLLDQIANDTDNAKTQARVAFDQARADIASRKGELQSRKAEMMMNALQSYQNLLSEIEARNTQFKQQLYLKAQQTQTQLDTFKNQAMQDFQAQWEGFQPPSWNVGGNTVAAFPTGTNLRGVTYMSGKNKEEEDLGTTETGAASALGL